MADNPDNDRTISDKPFAWIIIPLAVFVFVGILTTIYQLRRRRRRRAQAQWPGQPITTPYGVVVVNSRRTGGSRWAPWSTARSQEGLNELGEAPPPYEGKKDGTHELRDLERGERPPPEYPAVPGPAVTTETRRSA